MPSPIAHVAAGFGLYRFFSARRKAGVPREGSRDRRAMAVVMGLSLLPDLDVLLGIPFGDLGRFHNQQMSSLFVGMFLALLVGLVAKILKAGFWRWVLIAVTCYALHLIMDSLTGGDGVMLLWPFSGVRFSSPVRFFYGLQWSGGLLNKEHILTFLSEGLFVLLVVFGTRWMLPSTRGR